METYMLIKLAPMGGAESKQGALVGMGIFRFLLVLVMSAQLVKAAEATADWIDAEYRYIVIAQQLRDVLIEFGRNVRVPVKISSAIQGQRVQSPVNSQEPQTAKVFLQHLCDAYGLVWFFDGTILYISSASEVETNFVQVEHNAAAELEKRLADVKQSHSQINVRISDDGTITVAGPPPYHSFVRTVITTLKRAEVPQERTVRVIRGL